MNSMTGFGKAELKTKTAKFTIEISSVNNRYLEISPRMPRQFFPLESKVREYLKSNLSRGKINLYIGFEESGENGRKYAINKDAARSYFKQLTIMKNELKISGDISIKDLILFPEVARIENGAVNDKKIWVDLKKVLESAVKSLLTMRQKEGSALSRDMKQRLTHLSSTLKKIKGLSKLTVANYRERLNKRVSDIMKAPLSESNRLEEEIAIMAERSDITEECTRFISHLDQYKSALNEKGAVGKKLNFILQELNREANTIASKCVDINIAKYVITVKEEIEKLREQVQNIE